ncbi:GNAT family N-acetyltransferase [Streptomyces sp. UP1A-1]|nr:GNAT family N-acetyltransferase [Streptomyces sp. UP1A-1]
MEPVTLTTGRLVLRTVGPQDTDAVYAACQDPDIQRWTTIPSPTSASTPGASPSRWSRPSWADDSMATFGLFLPAGDLVGMLGVTMISLGVGEIGFWCAEEHRGHGYVTEAAVAVARWAFTDRAIDRLEWRAEVGNTASRAVARRAGFTVEGTLRSAINNKGTRRDAWIGSLLPSDLALPSTAPYLPPRP